MRLEGLIFVIYFSAGLLVATAAGAEETVMQPQPIVLDAVATEAMSISPDKKAVVRDPFAATSRLVRKAQEPKSAPPQSPDPMFKPQVSATPVRLPEMRLRGHIQNQEGELVALLQIGDGEVHIVREGDTVGLHEKGLDSVIRVKQISRLHLVIESGSLERLIIVR